MNVIETISNWEEININQLILDGVIESISKFPPMDVEDDILWKSWERVPDNIKIGAKAHWEWVGRYLDAYFNRKSDPLPESGQTELEQAIIRTYSRYYIALYDVLFNAERFIKAEFKRQNIHYPFNCVGKLFYALILEDIAGSLEPCVQDYWESLSAPLQLEGLQFYSQFWKDGKINTQKASRLEKQIKKAEKLQPNCGRWNRWNLFCRQVFAMNRQQLQPSLKAFGDAHTEIYRFWTSQKSPGCDRLKKILFINGAFVESPIGKNRRKSLT